MGHPPDAGIPDDDGHPLTWGRVCSAHAWLVLHAACADAVGGYDSDGDAQPCPCQFMPQAIEERASHMRVCAIWARAAPGPICGTCWAASCACGYVFEGTADARERAPCGRFRCAACADVAAAVVAAARAATIMPAA